MQKRPLTLTASILNIIAHTISILMLAYITHLVVELINSPFTVSEDIKTSLVFCMLEYISLIIFNLISIVFSIKGIKISKSSIDIYNKECKNLANTMVINAAYIFFTLIDIIIGLFGTIIYVIYLVIWTLQIISIFMFTKDIKRNLKEKQKQSV